MPHDLLQKLRRTTPVEWGDLLRAYAALLRAQVTVWTRPQGQLVSASAPGTTENSGGNHARARQLGHAVRRASRYSPARPSCLVRSVALIRLLERHGIHGGLLRIGVRPHDGKLLAHAWVEHDGEVLGDRPAHVRSFHPLADVDVLPGSRSR